LHQAKEKSFKLRHKFGTIPKHKKKKKKN